MARDDGTEEIKRLGKDLTAGAVRPGLGLASLGRTAQDVYAKGKDLVVKGKQKLDSADAALSARVGHLLGRPKPPMRQTRGDIELPTVRKTSRSMSGGR